MKYINSLLLFCILASCNNKMLDMDNNFVLYENEFGKDPIIIVDKAYKPANKNRMYIYPKNLMHYEIREKEYTTSDNRKIKFKIGISYIITDPIAFYHNNIKIESIGYKLNWSIEEEVDSFFNSRTYENLISNISDLELKLCNQVNKSEIIYYRKRILGLKIVEMQINYDDSEIKNEDKPLLDVIIETMKSKS